ncbi:MAG TPA: DUF4013 domain-containing protein [Candidatus Dormibacteraeota bacterium]
MTEFGDAFAWPAKDPRWVGKLILVGLIGLIPIVGQMNLLGWTLSSLDNLRADRYELADANFSHLGRGARLFLVQLVYAALLFLVAAVIFVPGIALLVSAGGSAGGAAAVGILLTSVSALVFFLLTLLYALVQPVIYLRTDRFGVGGGLDFGAIARTLGDGFVKTLLAALLMYVGGMIGGLGIIACFVGLVFTIPYGYAVVAGVLRVYEQQLTSPAPS